MSVVQTMLNYLNTSRLPGDASHLSISSAFADGNDTEASQYGTRGRGIEATRQEMEMIVCSTVYTVSILAQRFKHRDLVNAVAAMLIQRVQTSDFGLGAPEGRSIWQNTLARIAFTGIAKLAAEQSEAEFADTSQALIEFSRSRTLLSDHDSASMVRRIAQPARNSLANSSRL